MKLLYTLNQEQMKALALGEGEEICYCVPADLSYDSRKMQVRETYSGKIWLVVTQERFARL